MNYALGELQRAVGKRDIMGIRTIIAVGFTLVVVNAQAATNSWIFGGSDFWDTGVRWS